MPTPKRRTVTRTTTGDTDKKRVVKKRKNKPTVVKTKTKSSTKASGGVTKRKTKTVGGKVVKSKQTRNAANKPMSRPDKKKQGMAPGPSYTGETRVTKQRRAPIGKGVKTKTVSKKGGNYTVSKLKRKNDGTTVQRTKAVGPKRGQRVMARRTRQVNRMR